MDARLPQLGNGQVAPRRLKGRQARFVDEYLKCGIGQRAAIAAGYSPRSAHWQSRRLLNENPGVMRAIAEGQAELRELAVVSSATMLAQFDEDRQFAIETKNATAAVRASELKAKLAGLMIERVDQRSVGQLRVEVVRFSDAGT
jgi:phage terminase small subunit